MSQEQEPYSGYSSGYTPQHSQPSQPAPQEYYGTPENPYGAQEDMGVSETASPSGTFEETPPSSSSQWQQPGARTYQETPPFSGTQQQPGAGMYGPPPYRYAPLYQSQPNFGYAPPRTKAPLPLGEAIKSLPRQYFKIMTKPSSMTFAEELGKASWDIIWFQLIIMAVVGAVLSFFALLIVTLIITSTASGQNSPPLPFGPAAVLGFGFVIILFIVILVPVSFFTGTGISYLIAKAFDGKGTFLEQCYTTLLINVPTSLLSGILSLIPFIGSLAGSALGIYAIILQIYALMAVHRVSGGKAALIYFIPWIALAVVYIIFFSIFIFFIFSASHIR